MHTLFHVLGIDTQQSYFYDFWSGIATQATLLLAGLGVYWRHSCHVSRCLRVARHPYGDYRLCRHHHPELPHRLRAHHLLPGGSASQDEPGGGAGLDVAGS